jgi:SAM-dependent methyltransferase
VTFPYSGHLELHRHWDEIYSSRPPDDVSWYEPVPSLSLKLIAQSLEEGAESVIDIGGGASTLVDHLLNLGLKRTAVLDISEAGLDISKRRLGSRARLVEWIIGDVTGLEDVGQFDIWHDRAVFHFLTDDDDRRHYVQLAERTVRPGGTAIMATFASDGPERCSGLEVRRYDPEQLVEQCGSGFELAHSERHVHVTPHEVLQNFQYSTFRRTGS